MELELKQVKIKLTTEKEVLNALRKRRALKKDERGEYFTVQFDSKSFTFRPGEVITVGDTVARNIMRSSLVVVGEDIDGEFKPAVVSIGSFIIGEEQAEVRRSMTACPVCNKDLGSLERLARHITAGHRQDRPDLYIFEKTNTPTQWQKPTAPEANPPVDGEVVEQAGHVSDEDDEEDDAGDEITMAEVAKEKVAA